MKFDFDPVSAISIANLAKKHDVKIIHCHNYRATSIVLLSQMFYKTKIIISKRSSVDSNLSPVALKVYKNSHIDAIIGSSIDIKKSLIDTEIEVEKLFVIPNAVDLKRVETTDAKHRIKNSLPPHSLLIGTVASFNSHKDYPTLIKAASMVLKTHPEVLFLAVGGGKLAPEIKKLINNRNISERFILAGQQDNIYDYFNAFDIFVFTPKTESNGTTLLDALNRSLPSEK